jgi:hypothetical protein
MRPQPGRSREMASRGVGKTEIGSNMCQWDAQRMGQAYLVSGGDRGLGSWGETRLREFRRTLGERVLCPRFLSTCDFDRRLVRNPGRMMGGWRRRSGRRDSCDGLAGVG